MDTSVITGGAEAGATTGTEPATTGTEPEAWESVIGRDFTRALNEGLARARATAPPRNRRPSPPAAAERAARATSGSAARGKGSAPRVRTPQPTPASPPQPMSRPPSSGIEDSTSADPTAAPDEHTDCRWQERRRVARDLHDHIGGALATARRLLIECGPGVDDPGRLAAAQVFLHEAEDHLRDMLGELVTATELPPLGEAIEGFAAEAAPPGLDVTVKITGNENLVATAHRRALFLAVREALRNTFEHAGASRVAVSVRTTRWWVHAAVEDDGRGFDPERVTTGTGAGRPARGIASMTQRIEDIGGKLAIESSPVDGTRVDMHLPLRPRT
ncbi:sensor histidine kinase [Streptomyces hesseae]|uniref:ATP-binding protein n=1 Tax=Streptomyces hesseae TaxID=3075519 RepID=A0ABU2SVF1_9ACTN|nr:ATP-binding protein [Streptomyces sp. DSM 40473]MDT0452830.1 ATP-binding protein [Streptomyces sp. DSM 40473]